jgi:hypothetical protein
MTHRIVIFIAAALLALAVASPARAQVQCTNFPWIVTGSDVPGGVVVNVCGLWVGCFPHDPRVTVSGDQVQITYTAAEPPICVCIAVDIPFNQNVFLPSLPQGTYTVTVTVVNCLDPGVVGTGTIVTGGIAAVPALDPRGTAIFALLLGIAALWKLTR